MPPSPRLLVVFAVAVTAVDVFAVLVTVVVVVLSPSSIKRRR